MRDEDIIMRERVQAQRENLTITMQRMQGLIRRAAATKAPTDQYQREYDAELAKYKSMRDGGDGGKFRESEFTIRELHFTHWRDSDFQLLLEAIGETPVLVTTSGTRASRANEAFLAGFLAKEEDPNDRVVKAIDHGPRHRPLTESRVVARAANRADG